MKQRITSRHGHLSNEAAAGVVGAVARKGAKLRRAVLGHLSRDCNQPDLAISTVRTQGGGGAESWKSSRPAGRDHRADDRRGRPPDPILTPEPACARGRTSPRTPKNRDSSQLDLFGALAF